MPQLHTRNTRTAAAEINKSSPQFRRGVAIERKRNPSYSAKLINSLVAYNLVEHPFMYREL